ncbi:BTB/POZ domain-containing protein 9 [Armadillidium nasatum]|uniref:BTB/POZ domain-containing protein 9 n=1 Tax=Armadillidium nasatum TaxID=96803 RepID=A0A5N5TE63_9CRUS|nr:BTB/POZ domain-containing protein 9 [Armadillidium nasatum]
MSARMTGNPLYSDKSFAGINRLIDDFKKLMQDTESADIIFIIGRDEIRIPAHKLILKARCKSIVETSGEVCAVPGSTVTPGNPHTTVRLPHYHTNIFQQVMTYIYTGKVVLNDSEVFEMFGVSQDLGLEELCQHCEDHLNGTMSAHNACTFLLAALNMEKRTGGNKGSSNFVDKIVAFIGENALECLQSTSFLNLSREALIRLISSDNASILFHTLILKCFCIVKVFAEEVEPTGAVPMELSLERYRYAALPNKFKDNSTNEDKRLQPRVSLKLFSGSQLLANDKTSLQRILNNWYGVGKQIWRLVYRASTHGYSADAFHRHCDGIAPTYVIVMGQHGEVCGGFSDVPWAKTSFKGKYVASEKAFLFTLVNDQDLPPTKFPVVKKMFAICYHPDCGPIFGAGADLFIASNCNQNLESYSNLPHSYDGENASCATLMGDYNFTVLDYEIFTPYGK